MDPQQTPQPVEPPQRSLASRVSAKVLTKVKRVNSTKLPGIIVVVAVMLIGLHFLFPSFADNDPNFAVADGTYQHFHGDDFVKDKDFDTYLVKEADGTQQAVDLGDAKDQIKPGTHIKVSGEKSGKLIKLDKKKKYNKVEQVSSENKASLLATAAGAIVARPATATGSTNFYRPITNLAVVIVNLQAADGSQSKFPPLITPAQAQSVFFGATGESVKTILSNSTYGHEVLNGHVFPVVNVQTPNNYCNQNSNYQTWANQAANIINAYGGHLENYSNVTYLMSCNLTGGLSPGQLVGAGWGYVGGRDTYLLEGWASTPGQIQEIFRTATHELGHNMDLNHANGFTCTDSANDPVALSTACANKEYGDTSDAMGTTLHRYDNYSTMLLDAMPANKIQQINNTTATVTLYSADLPSSQAPGPQAILLPRSYPINSLWGLYDLEYRSAASPEDNWGTGDLTTQGVSIRIVPWQSNASAHILDMTPGDNNFYNAPLTAGTFYDPYAHISISVVSRTTTSITLKIQGLLQAPSSGLSIKGPAYTTPAAAGGTWIVVSGNGFGTGTKVSVDGVTALTNVQSPTQLMFSAPAHAAGSASIKVTTNMGANTTQTGSLHYVSCNTALSFTPPTITSAVAVSSTAVKVSWSPMVIASGGCPAKLYNIYRTNADGSGGALLSSTDLPPVTTSSYTDATTKPGTTYKYYVQAADAAEHHLYSAPVLVTTPAQ